MSYRSNQITREAIDKLLKRNASIQANLGTDSTEMDRFQAKIQWAEILRDIRKLDAEFAEAVSPQ